MAEGTIVIGGTAGDMLGFNMLDGTVLVLGDCGIRVGAGMRAGTISLFGPTPPPMLPSFRFDRSAPPEKLVSVLNELRDKGFPLDAAHLPAEIDVYTGDLVASGTGEIYLPRRAAA
jgi:formylmethanofuran dehydrogenase subunit C